MLFFLWLANQKSFDLINIYLYYSSFFSKINEITLNLKINKKYYSKIP